MKLDVDAEKGDNMGGSTEVRTFKVEAGSKIYCEGQKHANKIAYNL